MACKNLHTTLPRWVVGPAAQLRDCCAASHLLCSTAVREVYEVAHCLCAMLQHEPCLAITTCMHCSGLHKAETLAVRWPAGAVPLQMHGETGLSLTAHASGCSRLAK